MLSAEALTKIAAGIALGTIAGATTQIAAAWLTERLCWEEASWLAEAGGNGERPPARPSLTMAIRDLQLHPRLAAACLALSACLGVWLLVRSGGIAAAVQLVLAHALLCVALIDMRLRLIPDVVTQPFLWLGLLVQLIPQTRTVGLEAALIGATAAYLLPWGVGLVFRLNGVSQAIGGGDLKLLAMLGAWFGAIFAMTILGSAAFLAILWEIWRRLALGGKTNVDFPFGPWLALAGLIGIALHAF